MHLTPYVREEEFELARTMEEKLLAAVNTGILFAGVSVHVSEIPWTTTNEDGQVIDHQTQRLVTYHIWVGCERQLPEKTVALAVNMLLSQELSTGLTCKISVHRGQVRIPLTSSPSGHTVAV